MVWSACTAAIATGVRPDTTILNISEQDGEAQMGVQNTENTPMLLNVEIIEMPEDGETSIFASPSVSRMEPNGKQVVRFLLEKPKSPLSVQHMKRVSFEGIPGRYEKPGERNQVSMTVRQIIPVVISPAGLKQDNEPWKFLTLKNVSDGKLELANPSPYVVRLSAKAIVLPGEKALQILTRTYILPGEKISIAYDRAEKKEPITGIRIEPASPWGYMDKPFDLNISP